MDCFFIDRMYVDQIVDRLSYAGKGVEFGIYVYVRGRVSAVRMWLRVCDTI